MQPRMSLSVTRPMRKTEIFTVLRAGLESPIARYSSGARMAGQRATQNEQYKRSVRPRLTLRCVLRSMRRTAICSLPHVGSELRTARCRCGGLPARATGLRAAM